MVGFGAYLLSVALLALLAASLGFAAVRVRGWLLPGWAGAPAHLVDAVLGVALLIWICELLGVAQVLYAWTLVIACVLLVGLVVAGPRVLSWEGGAGRALGSSPESEAAVREGGRGEEHDAAPSRHPLPTTPAGATAAGTGVGWGGVAALGVVALVFAQWGLTAADAAGRGMFNFDSLWYHMPFAVDMAKSHSVTGFLHTETVFTNWFYPQNSELVHAAGILLTGRDTLSLFLNFGWLAIAFLAAWCIGRPYGRAPLSVVAVAVVLDAHTLVVREPGAAKNDVMAAALILAAIAILLTAASRSDTPRSGGLASRGAPVSAIAMAGLATGLAAGTKSTAMAIAAVLSLAVIVMAPSGRRGAVAAWWFLPTLAGGGYWYLRNLIAAGNPIPQIGSLGPIPLPHPETIQSGRPDFTIAHYATDTGIWRDYFAPGLDHAFGALWPLVALGALLGGAYALLRGRPATARWVGAAAILGLLAYVFTPLSAAGPEGDPAAFSINVRFAIPALLVGLALLPLAIPTPSKRSAEPFAAQRRKRFRRSADTPANDAAQGDVPAVSRPYGRLTAGTSREVGPSAALWWWAALVGGVLVLVATDRSDAVVRHPDRVFAWALAGLLVLAPAALVLARGRGASRGVVAGGFALLAIVVAAVGYPVQRHYLQGRFANADPATAIPGMDLDAAYRWARGVRDARIGLVGTTAGFHGYGFYGTDLSNQVVYLGGKGSRGAFDPLPTCSALREAVDDAHLDYLVTAPLLNFVDPDRPVPSPEARWLRGEAAVRPLLREGAVTVWRVDGPLAPAGCGPANAPLRDIPGRP